MLEHFWHWRFAKKLSPALQENRLLYFANDDGTGDDNGGLSENVEGAPEQPEQVDEAKENVADLTNSLRGKLDRVRPLAAQAVTNSPFAFETALHILEAKTEEPDTEITTLIREARNYLQHEDAGESVDGEKEYLTKEIESLLDRPDIAAAIAEGFSYREKRITELKNIVGETEFKDIASVEADLTLQEGVEISADAILDKQVEDILKRLKIDPKTALESNTDGLSREEKAALEGVVGSTNISRQDVKNGKPTKEYKVRLIQAKVNAARQLAEIERKDIGKDTTLTGTKELETAFAKQTLHVRKHFERVLMLRAAELRERWNALGNRLGQDANSTKFEAIAESLGISAIDLTHRITEIDDTLQRALRRAEREDGTNAENLSKPSDPNFLASAKKIQMQLDKLSWLDSDDLATQKKEFIGTAENVQSDAEEWIRSRAKTFEDTAKRLRENPDELERLEEVLGVSNSEEMLNGLDRHAEVATRAQSGELTSEDQDHLHDNLSENKRSRLNQLLIAASSPTVMTQMRRDKKLIENDKTTNTEDVRNKTLEDFQNVENELFVNGSGSALKLDALQHEVCNALPIADGLSSLARDIERKLRVAVHTKDPKGTELIAECRLNIVKLQKTVDEMKRLEGSGTGGLREHIQRVSDPQEYAQYSGTPDTIACYNRRTSTIYLNESAIASAANTQRRSADTIRTDAIYHEQGHAILHLLMHRIGVLPGLMIAMRETLAQEIPGDAQNRTYAELLQTRANAWGVELNRQTIFDFEVTQLRTQGKVTEEAEIQRIARRNTEDQIQELLMDELANKYATWKNNNKSSRGFSQEDISLFALIETGESGLQGVRFNPDADRELPDVANVASHMSEEEAAALAEDGGEGGGGAKINVAKTEDDIADAQNELLMINQFIKNHEKVDGLEAFAGWTKEWEDYFEKDIKQEFYSKKSGDSRVPEKVIAERIEDMKTKFIEKAKKQMAEVTKMEMDETRTAQSKRGLWAFIGSIEFVSINDMIATVKSAGEDLGRMWKRRGERVQSILGHNLTDWIPDNNIWGAKYAGQLKHEFERRSNASELEEVKQWKDALENVDSFELIELLGTARDKDQLRAIIELLTEKGRLDWGNKEFWKTLKRVSGLPMPIEACKNNSVLRDQWLQRMTTHIWDDKDKFFEWRQANDSNISSGKEKFTQVADQLSNIRGGLAGALERQLKLWVENKDTGSIPEEVNPHLYEKLLHYAMSNGKMSMEEKMFYLVQGACHGLITIDRVQALAGENGGVLNQFPVIDYFNTNHNTLPELLAISERITESGNKFKPGQKTTIWVHLEVTRDEDAVMRMSKAMSGARTESLDHEDIPTLAAMADFKTVEELTGVLSGSRFKISYEAAKNFYTGPGTKLKILARKAQLHKDGDARFTDEDAMQAAKTIVSFVHFDNIVTGNGTDGKPRISLTHDQIATQTAPSTDGHVIQDYRDPLHSFATQVLNNSNISWGEGKLEGITTDTYLSNRANSAKVQAEGDETPTGKKNFNASEEIEKQLKVAFLENPSMLIKLLADQVATKEDEFKEESYYDRMEKKHVGKFIDMRMAA